MDTEIRQTISNLTEQLCKDSKQYSFFQLVYLLERHFEQIVSVGDRAQGQIENELIRFRPAASLAFPSSDISELEYIPSSEYKAAYFRLTTNFMGLYGSSSPLPAFFTEAIIIYNDFNEDQQRRDFMDVFHHRFYALLYQTWKKYRYYIQYKTGAKDQFSQRMYSLIGLGNEHLRTDDKIHWERLLSYTGLLGMRSRSATVIENILSDYFCNIPVMIEQCVLRHVAIEASQQNRLGEANCSLGDDFIIGDSISDRAGKFRLILGPLNFECFQDFLPSGQYYQSLLQLVNFLLVDPLDFDLKLILNQQDIPVWTLSYDSPCCLGWSMWNSDLQEDGAVILNLN